jgi:hypothetical protein
MNRKTDFPCASHRPATDLVACSSFALEGVEDFYAFAAIINSLAFALQW